DQLRVTIVATGLGKPAVRQQMKPQSLTVVAQKTGTDNQPVEVDYDALEQPAVIRRRNRDATIEAMRNNGVEMLDIPAFLRKQAGYTLHVLAAALCRRGRGPAHAAIAAGYIIMRDEVIFCGAVWRRVRIRASKIRKTERLQ